MTGRHRFRGPLTRHLGHRIGHHPTPEPPHSEEYRP